MEDQTPSTVSESLDFLTPEDLATMKLMESNDWVVNESHGDDFLLHWLAAREVFFDRLAVQENPDIESRRAMTEINMIIRAKKQELGIDTTIEP